MPPILRPLFLALSLCLLAAPWSHAEAARRVALVIGNNAYPGAPLLNPVNDARAMAATLEASGFAVMLRTDANQREMLAAVREFGDRLKDGGGVGIFYFAGHGMQIKGRNFLIPVGSQIEREDEVAYQAIEAQAVLDKMESAGNGTNLMILDACRDNPFMRSFRSASRGLAPMDAPVGTLVAFAAAPGQQAADGQGSNGLYTSHLLSALRQPGLKVEDVFKQVRSAVRRESQGRQVPMEWSSLEGDFYFVPAVAVAATGPSTLLPPPAAPAIDPQAAIEEALWSAVKDSTHSAEIFAYLNRYPSGLHARQARQRLLNLSAPPQAAAPALPNALNQPSAGALQLPPGALPDPPRSREDALGLSALKLEEISTWGDVGTDRRPANPRRNGQGFAEGDRFRYLLIDQTTERRRHYLWRVDRIDADGGLWVNDGSQRLDGLGQRRGGNDEESGEWVEWITPLPLVEAVRRGAGHGQAVNLTAQTRDADGRTTRYVLSGRLLNTADGVRGPGEGATLLPAVKVQLELQGTSERSDGVRRQVRWDHAYWYAQGLPLPAEMEFVESADGLSTRRARHLLVAVDALSVPATLASSGK